MSFIGYTLSNVRDNDKLSADWRTRKFYAAVNAVAKKLGRVCNEEIVWTTVLGRQLSQCCCLTGLICGIFIKEWLDLH